MLNAIWTHTCGLSRAIFRAVPWTRWLTGVGAGWILLAVYQQYLAQLGCSTIVIAAVWCLTGVAWTLAWGRLEALGSRLSENRSLTRTVWQEFAIPGCLLLIVAAGPWIWMLHDLMLNEVILGSSSLLFGYAAIWAAVMLAIPVWCVARLALNSVDRGAIDSGSKRSEGATEPQMPLSGVYLFGIVCGLTVGLSWSFGNLYVASILAGLVIIAARASSLRWESTHSGASAQHCAVTLNDQGADTPRSPDAGLEHWSRGVTALACGGLLVWLSNVIGLLLVTTIFTFTAIVAGALAGVALSIPLGSTTSIAVRRRRLWSTCWLTASVLTLTGGFSFVVHRLVTISGSVSQVWLLQGLRDLFVAGIAMPIGLAWGLSSLPRTSTRRNTSRLAMFFQPGAGVAWAMLGGLLIQGTTIPVLGLSATAYLLVLMVAAVSLGDVALHAELPAGVFRRALLTACGLALICSPIFSGGIRPDLASRLLFSTNVFMSEKSGIPRSQLPFLDDCRLTQVQSSEHGVLTVWKSAVSRHQVRENGIPRGSLSTNTGIAPQPSAEVLTSLLPLTLHAEPRHVALLGAGAGIPLFTCFGSTDIAVTLVESDSKLVSVLQQLTANTELDWIWQEARLSHVAIDPALWVIGSGSQFDVVISNADQSALVRSASMYTQEFYRRASRRLTADGIFCQRFAYHDFGPAPIQSLSATLRSVFTHVMAVETGPGEIAFLATNSPQGLIRASIVDRVQSLHASEAMASIGWDWSVLLTLGAYDAEHLDKIQDAGHARINSAQNGMFSTQLPPELMRWGPKSAEVAQTLAPQTGKILNWLGEVSNREDLLRRLSEVRAQQELLSNYTDQYWAYRAQVRKQVSSRPMSLIQKVKHEDGRGGLHPEDKWRLRYFQQLSKAIHSKSPEQIQRLESFTSPYDPLVSLFVHQELAEIAARVPGSDSQMQLEHRLHTLFFTSSNDRSVRNGLAALRLVLEKPESVPSESDRFDTLNSLMQSLQYRWEARGHAQPGNAKEVARDVEENIVLGEKGLLALTELAPRAGVSAADCEARRHVIERMLLQPLRTYRARLEPHVARQKMKALEAAELEDDLPGEEEIKFPGADK